MALVLRPDQEALIQAARHSMRNGNRRVLMQAPTGFGKTVTVTAILKTIVENGKSAWFLLHRRELIEQSIRTLSAAGISAGIVASGYPMQPSRSIQVASIQSLKSRAGRLRAPDLIVCDEVHHVSARSWHEELDKHPTVRVIGLTATPYRLDGRGLSDHFDDMVCGPTTAELIERGNLAGYRLFAPFNPDLHAVQTVAGEYNKGQLGKAMDTPRIIGDAVAEYRKLAPGRKALVFACSIEHSKHIRDKFLAVGVKAAHLDGKTGDDERADTVQGFRDGRFDVLCNVELFGEGFDVPDAEVAILLRPTKSLGLYLQQVGRVLRPKADGRKALILDHSGNSSVHGLPCDDREWSLEGRKKAKKDADKQVMIRVCPSCYAANKGHAMTCSECGYEWSIVAREVEQEEGELIEVDPVAIRREKAKAQGMAQGLSELVQLGVERGYKDPAGWARHIFDARRRKTA